MDAELRQSPIFHVHEQAGEADQRVHRHATGSSRTACDGNTSCDPKALTTSATWQTTDLRHRESNVFTGAEPATGHAVATIEGEGFEALTTTQILAGSC